MPPIRWLLIRVPARRNITAGRTDFRTVRLNGSGTRRCVFAGDQTSRAPRHRCARWPLSAGFDVPHSRRAEATARGIFPARRACICKSAVLKSDAGKRSERVGVPGFNGCGSVVAWMSGDIRHRIACSARHSNPDVCRPGGRAPVLFGLVDPRLRTRSVRIVRPIDLQGVLVSH